MVDGYTAEFSESPQTKIATILRVAPHDPCHFLLTMKCGQLICRGTLQLSRINAGQIPEWRHEKGSHRQ